MKRYFTVTAVILTIALASCSGSQKKNNVLDSQWQPKGRAVAYKKFTTPKKWIPGHYIVTGKLSKGERTSIDRTTVVRKENGGWVFETISTDKKGKVTGMQMLIKGYENAVRKSDGSQLSIVWIKTLQEDGTIQLLEGDALVMYNTMLKSTWQSIVVTGNKYVKGEAVNVPAGAFQGTTKITATVKVLFKTVTATTYLHPDVPVNGVVKTVSDDGEVMSELLDYGFDGKAYIK